MVANPFRAWASRRGRFVVGLLCLVVLGAGTAVAELFKWQDEQGGWHFAQDLNQVPPRYRRAAQASAVDEGTGGVVQHYQPHAAPPAAPRRAARGAGAVSPRSVHQIRVDRTGSVLRVNVTLNDQVTAPFYVDTGASDVVLPESVARQLGLDLSGARTAYYGTANGTIEQSLVTLDSVSLGSARAERVPASVSKTMSVGLLGLSFFNHFRYRVDPVAGVITLQANGLVEAGLIRGGRSEAQWRTQFAGLASRRDSLRGALERANPNRSRQRASLVAEVEEVDRQLRVLEDEADEARVPMFWRD